METGKLIISMGVTLVLCFAGAGVYAFRQAGDDQPIVGRHFDLASPNGDWIATSEEVDNGLGFGQGMLYHEVHVRRPNTSISSHGDRAESAIFYVSSMGANGELPSLSWRDATHLVVGYDSKTSAGERPGKSMTSFHGISIEYRVKPQT